MYYFFDQILIKAPFSSKVGTLFSGIYKNHVGILLSYDGTNITIQDGNYDGKTNTFEDTKKISKPILTRLITIDQEWAVLYLPIQNRNFILYYHLL